MLEMDGCWMMDGVGGGELYIRFERCSKRSIAEFTNAHALAFCLRRTRMSEPRRTRSA